MFYVLCPNCGSHVEVPNSAVGTNRTDPWNVILCDACDMSFDYDDQEVHDDMAESEKRDPLP